MIMTFIGIMASLGVPYLEGRFEDGLIRAYILPNGNVIEVKLE